MFAAFPSSFFTSRLSLLFTEEVEKDRGPNRFPLGPFADNGHGNGPPFQRAACSALKQTLLQDTHEVASPILQSEVEADDIASARSNNIPACELAERLSSDVRDVRVYRFGGAFRNSK